MEGKKHDGHFVCTAGGNGYVQFSVNGLKNANLRELLSQASPSLKAVYGWWLRGLGHNFVSCVETDHCRGLQFFSPLEALEVPP